MMKNVKMFSKITFYSTGIFVCFFILLILFGYLGDPKKSNHSGFFYFSFFPQAWSFFSNNPTSPKLYIMENNQDKTQKISKYLSLENDFGLSYKNKILLAEVENIYSNSKNSSFYMFQSTDIYMLQKTLVENSTKTNFTIIKIKKGDAPHFNGEYFLVKEYPAKWIDLYQGSSNNYQIFPIQIVQYE